MTNQIEGKEVDPHLLTIVEKPHLVPAWIAPFHQGVGNKYVVGYVDGYIRTFETKFVVERIRELITNILNKKIGKASRSQNKKALVREIDALGREIILVRGLRAECVLTDECQFDSTEDRQYYYDKLAIAGEGYIFTDEHRKKRRDRDHIVLDADGQWIRELLGKKGAEGKGMDIKEQKPDGEIILTPENYHSGWGYPDNYFKVADITDGKNRYPENFPIIMAIILRVHNLLYAIHKTCIGEEGLPGGIYDKWELPRAE